MSDKQITFTRTRRCHAIVEETVNYSVSAEAYQALIDDGATEEEALQELLENGECESTACEVELEEVLAEHNSTLALD